MPTRRVRPSPVLEVPSSEALVDRARRFRRRGETRKMLVALREACMRNEQAAWIWTLYGATLATHGHVEDARWALKHAMWLRKTQGDAPRLRSTQAFFDRVDAGLPLGVTA